MTIRRLLGLLEQESKQKYEGGYSENVHQTEKNDFFDTHDEFWISRRPIWGGRDLR